METGRLFLGFAVVCAFAAGALAARCAMRCPALRNLARPGMSFLEAVHTLRDNLLTRGVRFALPLSDRLLRHRFAANALMLLEEWLKSRGLDVQLRACASSLVCIFALALVVLSLVLGSLPSACAVIAGIIALALAFLRSFDEKRAEDLRRAIPDSISSMRSCFQAGLSLEQTLDQLSAMKPEMLGHAYGSCAQAMRMGISASHALAELREEVRAPELAFVSVALDVQHQAGGSLTQVLQTAEESMIEQFDLERSLSVQTTQARLSARVVSAMPFVLLAVFSLVTKDFLSPFFQSVAGVALFALALIMQLAGIMLVRRMLMVRGVSR